MKGKMEEDREGGIKMRGKMEEDERMKKREMLGNIVCVAFKGIPATPLFYQVLYCHNEGAPLRMIRYEGTTEGKRARRFFKWVDKFDNVCELQQVVLERDTQIIELEIEKDALKEKIRRLKAKKETLFNEVEEMRMAITETMFELKENIKEKRMMLTMIFLLGIFYSYSVHD
ncbi:hypothetical protein RDABS01_021146, partial [Bienertia sinuspersici]